MTYTAALVTGGAHRLGRAMALHLAARGVAVAIHYATSVSAAQALVDEIKATGGNAAAVQADLLDLDDTQGLVAKASTALGLPLDVLVNNASIFEYDRIDTLSAKSWDRHMNSNLRAAVFLTQAFAAQLPKAQAAQKAEAVARGCIVNMVDQRVRKLTPEFMTYSLAKAGLWTFTQTAAQALAPDVRVNAIGPGPTLKGVRQTQEHFDQQRANTILQRGANEADICAALGYLLDAPAVTGQLICVDGGQHLGWKTPDIINAE